MGLLLRTLKLRSEGQCGGEVAQNSRVSHGFHWQKMEMTRTYFQQLSLPYERNVIYLLFTINLKRRRVRRRRQPLTGPTQGMFINLFFLVASLPDRVLPLFLFFFLLA